MLQDAARRVRARGIDGLRVLVNVLDHACLVHHERRAVGEAALCVQNAVLFRDLALKIAQQWIGEPELLRELPVGGGTVYTDPENLSVVRFELGDISLIRLKLLRSTPRESEDVKRQHNVLLAVKIA